MNKCVNLEDTCREGERKKYLICGVEFIVHEAGDDAGFSDGLIPQKHQLVLC